MRTFSRDELVLALRTATEIIMGMPNINFMAPPVDGMIRMAGDGGQVTSPHHLPLDGAPAINGSMKGIAQPARKRHMLSPKVKQLDRVDWAGIPRAGRRIAEELNTHGPATSHELMERLHVARPTFNNAMSKLRKKKLVASIGLRDSGSAEHR